MILVERRHRRLRSSRHPACQHDERGAHSDADGVRRGLTMARTKGYNAPSVLDLRPWPKTIVHPNNTGFQPWP
jgi:hypothetical protein